MLCSSSSRLAVLCLLAGLAPAAASVQDPQWIWISSEAGADERMWTCEGFITTTRIVKATLSGSCDNAFAVYLDEDLVLEGTEWQVRSVVDLTDRLDPGSHSLAARGFNEGGPAGLWLELVVEYEGGRVQTLVTDGSWQVSAEPTEGWMSATQTRSGWVGATSLGALGVEPWGMPVEMTSGQPVRALQADELELLPGFEAELLYSVPKDEQGSWVSMTFDPQGRLLASDQYGAIYRVTVPAWGQELLPENIQPLDVKVGRAHGLLHAFGSLYVVVADGDNTGLHRVRDVDGDDRYDSVEFLMPLDGSGEHGPHAVILSPDGEALYVVAGNHTELPATLTRSRPTRVWAEDQLLPRMLDPNGHAVGRMAPGGWVCRVDRDGTEWELVAAGMRNSYDIAFDRAGELFTFDSDMEWDVGLPWYRPTRILNLVSGADFGWRNGSGKWPAHYPDTLPSAVDVGLGSPTGILFGHGTRFHGPYREALFASDWALGRIYAVHLEAHGASSTASFEVFASGKPFPVTDLATGPDGALYITTGGRRTQSGVYRIRSTREPAPSPQAAANTRALASRRRIERAHGSGVPGIHWSELGSDDRFVAHAARTALEQNPVGLWAEKALAERNYDVALQALLALARVAPEQYGERILERITSLPLDQWSDPELLGWLRVIGVTCARAGSPDPLWAERLERRLAPRFPSGHLDLDRELCRLLVYLESPSIAALAVEKIESSEDPADQIHYAYCLRTLRTGWTLPLRRRYFRWLNEVGPTMSGGHSLAKYVEAIRADAIDVLPAELRSWPELLRDPRESTDAQVVEASALRFVRAWAMADLEQALPQMKDSERDLEQGARWFELATCSECHRFDGQGGSTGPDLTGASGRFSARDLLESILEPSKEVSDQYQDTEILTTDGELFVGRVEQRDAEHVVLMTLSDGDDRVELLTDEIDILRLHPISRMPAGLLDSMHSDEILDLLAYCLSR